MARIGTINLDGLLFPDIFPKENFYLVRDLELRDKDIVLAAYPKCGTHWISYIIYSILHPEEQSPQGESIRDFCRFVDLLGFDKTKVVPEDEVQMFVTHIPVDYLRLNSPGKFVGVIRNPLDCCVSLHVFLQDMENWKLSETEKPRVEPVSTGDEPISAEFFDSFVEGDIPYGPIFKYAKSLYERKDEPNVHFIVFEKMKANPREEILRLARFLGYAEGLEANNGLLLDKIVEQSSFNTMKKDVVFKHPTDGGVMNVLRKGKAGGYRDSLSAEQIKILKDMMEKELQGTELFELWKDI